MGGGAGEDFRVAFRGVGVGICEVVGDAPCGDLRERGVVEQEGGVGGGEAGGGRGEGNLWVAEWGGGGEESVDTIHERLWGAEGLV